MKMTWERWESGWFIATSPDVTRKFDLSLRNKGSGGPGGVEPWLVSQNSRFWAFWGPKPPKTAGLRNICCKRSFGNLVADILKDVAVVEEQELKAPAVTYRLGKPAMLCLHEASEVFLSDLFSQCAVLAAHAKRKTLFLQDLQVVLSLQARRLLKWHPWPTKEKRPTATQKDFFISCDLRLISIWK